MLEDRDYMRQPEFDDGGWRPGFHLRWSWTMLLLLVNLVIFVLLETNKAYNPVGFVKIVEACALSSEKLFQGDVWQLFTFQFLHLARWHFVGNMLGLFFLGRIVENMMGGKRFIVLYLASGFVGGIFQSLLGVVFPSVFGMPVVGASAGVFGLLAALATLAPNAEFLVFFVFPVKAKYLALAGAIVATFYIVVPAEPGIAHAAHLGGMAMGWFYVRKILNSSWDMRLFDRSSPREETPDEHPAETSNADFVTNDVDAILDKISAKGIQSLTTREREILEKARARMVKR